MIELLVKRGDTFSREVAAFADDVPQDLTTATVRCQVRRGPLVRDAGTLIQELTVTLDPPPAVGVFTIFASAAPTVITTTNLPGSLAFTMGLDASGIGIDKELVYDFGNDGFTAASVGTATTVVAPIVTGAIWRINVFYRLGA